MSAEPPIPASHLPYWLVPFAEKIRLNLREKIVWNDLEIDMKRMMYVYPSLTREQLLTIIAWYEDGLLDTKFTIVNDPGPPEG